MSQPRNSYVPEILSFADFTLDIRRGSLLRNGQEIQLRPKSYQTLKYLVENPGRILAKDELMQAVWPDSFVTDDSLVQCLRDVRRALGDESQQYVKTLPRRGYLFSAVVTDETRTATPIVTERVEGVKVIIEQSQQDSLISRNKKLLTVLSILALLSAAGFLWSRSTRSELRRSNANAFAGGFVGIQSTQLTNLGSVMGIAISPDGHYVVYALEEAGLQSLWLRQIANESSKQITTPAAVRYFQLVFSNDGNYLYYASRPTQQRVADIYRIPLLGGTPSRLLQGVEGYFALSPDDQQICFVRDSATEEESRLLIASMNGQERELATRHLPERFRYPAWSPDGQVIVSSVGNFEASGSLVQAIEVLPTDGRERRLTTNLWPGIDQKVWLPDGSGLLMIAGNQVSRPYQRQIWFMSYPDGQARQLTNDVTSYLCLSLTKDAATVATLQTSLEANVWVTNLGIGGRTAKIATGAGGFSWTPDGRIVFASHASGSKEIWIMNPDGSARKQLTFSNGFDTNPAVSPDGSHIVFASDHDGSLNLWQMKIDGSDLERLTSGEGEDNPRFSPDGDSLFYTSVGNWRLWRLPAEGGEPRPLGLGHSEEVNPSPDGKWLATFGRAEQPDDHYQIVVSPVSGDSPPKTFVLAKDAVYVSSDIRWTPDSKAVTYVSTQAGVSNLWSQPLNGEPAKQLTNFDSDQIFHFDLSPNGQELVCSRGRWAHDVALIKSVDHPTAQKQN